MLSPFYLNWKQDGQIISGYDIVKRQWVNQSLVFPVSFPGLTTLGSQVTLSTSARDWRSFETLINLQLFASGLDVETVLQVWPFYGIDRDNPCAPQQPKPELNGGLELSFDQGRSWRRLQYNPDCIADQNNLGYAPDDTTWIELPQLAIGANSTDGVLGPFDQATMMVRLVIPPQADQYKVIDIRLDSNFDVQ